MTSSTERTNVTIKKRIKMNFEPIASESEVREVDYFCNHTAEEAEEIICRSKYQVRRALWKRFGRELLSRKCVQDAIKKNDFRGLVYNSSSGYVCSNPVVIQDDLMPYAISIYSKIPWFPLERRLKQLGFSVDTIHWEEIDEGIVDPSRYDITEHDLNLLDTYDYKLIMAYNDSLDLQISIWGNGVVKEKFVGDYDCRDTPLVSSKWDTHGNPTQRVFEMIHRKGNLYNLTVDYSQTPPIATWSYNGDKEENIECIEDGFLEDNNWVYPEDYFTYLTITSPEMLPSGTKFIEAEDV